MNYLVLGSGFGSNWIHAPKLCVQSLSNVSVVHGYEVFEFLTILKCSLWNKDAVPICISLQGKYTEHFSDIYWQFVLLRSIFISLTHFFQIFVLCRVNGRHFPICRLFHSVCFYVHAVFSVLCNYCIISSHFLPYFIILTLFYTKKSRNIKKIFYVSPKFRPKNAWLIYVSMFNVWYRHIYGCCTNIIMKRLFPEQLF